MLSAASSHRAVPSSRARKCERLCLQVIAQCCTRAGQSKERIKRCCGPRRPSVLYARDSHPPVVERPSNAICAHTKEAPRHRIAHSHPLH